LRTSSRPFLQADDTVAAAAEGVKATGTKASSVSVGAASREGAGRSVRVKAAGARLRAVGSKRVASAGARGLRTVGVSACAYA